MTPKQETLETLKKARIDAYVKAYPSIKVEEKIVVEWLVDLHLKRALEDEESRRGIGGREKRLKVFTALCSREPDKRTKLEKEKDETLKKLIINVLIKMNPFDIDTKILNKIKDLNIYRVIFIVGGNENIVDRVTICLSRIYTEMYATPQYTFSLEDDSYTVKRPGLRRQSYVGWSEADITDHLFSSQKPNPLFDYFKDGNMLFLRGIKNNNIFERLMDSFDFTRRCGLLLINVDNDVVSQDLLIKAETIYLETTISFDNKTNKIIINENEFNNIPIREYKLFRLLYENKRRLVSKREIMNHLETGGEWSESQVFKLINIIKTKFSESGIQFKTVKQTKNQTGGYQMIF